jgi:hypothetical protein
MIIVNENKRNTATKTTGHSNHCPFILLYSSVCCALSGCVLTVSFAYQKGSTVSLILFPPSSL